MTIRRLGETSQCGGLDEARLKERERLVKKQLCTREEICKLQVLVTGDSI